MLRASQIHVVFFDWRRNRAALFSSDPVVVFFLETEFYVVVVFFRQKLVLKIDMLDESGKRKAMKTVAGLSGLSN